KLLTSQEEARHIQQRLNALFVDLRKGGGQPSRIDRAVLSPRGGHHGAGGALRLHSTSPSRFPDQLVVAVGGLDRSGAPYRVRLVGPEGRRFLLPGFMQLDPGGGETLSWPGDLGRYRMVQVIDARGRLALSGSFA